MKKLFANMNKTLRRILVIVLAVAAGCGALWGGLSLAKNAGQGEVNVYLVRDFSMTDYYGDSAQTSGNVTTDRLQKVYISSTQTVTDIFVTEGQTVKKGDKLLAFDTTLTSLDLQRAEIALERQELEQKTLKNKLEALKNVKCLDELKKEVEDLQKELEEQIAKEEQEQTRPLPDHSQPALPPYHTENMAEPDTDKAPGTVENPCYAEYTDALPQATLSALMTVYRPYVPFTAPDPDPNQPMYVLLVSWDTETEEYVPVQAMRLTWDDTVPETPALEMALCDESLPMPVIERAVIEDSSEVKKLQETIRLLQQCYDDPDLPETYMDFVKLKSRMEKELEEQEVSLKIAQLQLKETKAEMQDGAVYAQLDGVVKVVRDAAEAYNEGSAVVEVSGGGGYYIIGSVSEMDLGTVKTGQSVTINSWMSGTTCQGEVVEISEYPTNTNTGWSGGNNNVSWYPMKIFVDDSADLQEGDWVDVTYDAAGGGSSDTWYLETMFLRTENGRSYVLLRGENGRLEQRFVQTGKDLWGSYTEILGGMTLEDYVAFPYGKGVGPGAKTVESTPDQFYNY